MPCILVLRKNFTPSNQTEFGYRNIAHVSPASLFLHFSEISHRLSRQLTDQPYLPLFAQCMLLLPSPSGLMSLLVPVIADEITIEHCTSKTLIVFRAS